MKKLNKTIITSILTLVILVVPTVIFAQEPTAGFLADNIMTAGNRSTPTVDWGDPISAKPGEVIEFRIVAQNTVPGSIARNVRVTASIPSNRATTITASGTVSADNAASVSDTATVNVTGGELQGFAYHFGHARIFSPSCPSGCAAADTITSGGIIVGNLAWGESAQVLFKAYVTNIAPEVGDTIAPPPGDQGQSLSVNVVLPPNASQNQSQTQNNTQSQTSNQNVNVNLTGSGGIVPVAPLVIGSSSFKAPAQLPKTGIPLLGWLALFLLLIGWRLKTYGMQKTRGDKNG